jgi:hypothetical protein
MDDDEYREQAYWRLAEASKRALADLPEAERERLEPMLAEGTLEQDWRVRATIDYDEGWLDPKSLQYVVQVAVMDGWAPLVRVPWRDLGLEWRHVEGEALAAARMRATVDG